jgi:GT2 family glycosyltransferase
MDLSIIIVNWNSSEYLIQCLRSIRSNVSSLTYEIIVVDNHSAPEDVEKIRAHADNIKLITCNDNLGFARANNRGFRASKGDVLLFLNPDTEIIGKAVSTLVRSAKELPNAGIVGCKLLNSDLTVQLSSIQKFPTIVNQVIDAKALQLFWPSCPLWDISPLFQSDPITVPVDVISGACIVTRRDVFEQIGLFGEDYFMYAEDVELSYKSHLAGLTNYYVGDVNIVHHGGKSSSQQSTSHWAIVMRHRAVNYLLRKTRGRLYGAAYRLLIMFAAALRVCLLKVAWVFASIVGRRSALESPARKWLTVLRWAVGTEKVGDSVRV